MKKKCSINPRQKLSCLGTLISSHSSVPLQGPDFISKEFDCRLGKTQVYNYLSCYPLPPILSVVLAVSNKQNFNLSGAIELRKPWFNVVKGRRVVTVNAHWPRLLLTLRPQNTSFNISKLQAACTYMTKREAQPKIARCMDSGE